MARHIGHIVRGLEHMLQDLEQMKLDLAPYGEAASKLHSTLMASTMAVRKAYQRAQELANARKQARASLALLAESREQEI